MNQVEFIQFLKNAGGGYSTPPANPFKKVWKSVKDAIKPHVYGEVPETLRKAFPNEDEEITKWRNENYQHKTLSPVEKAMGELLRLLSTSKHSVYFQNVEMQNWYKSVKFNGKDLFSYFFDVVVPMRILDPNAVMVILPTGRGLEDDRVQVDIKLQIISSDRMIFNDPDEPLIIYRDVNRKKYTAINDVMIDGVYTVITDEFYGEIKEGEFRQLYAHNSGMNPWFTLGGRAKVFYDGNDRDYVVYYSDFSPAVPYLNDAAIFDNQDKAIMLASGFPLRFVKGLQCMDCGGHGYFPDQEDHTKKIECKSCEGSGLKQSFSPMGAYNVVTPPTVPKTEGEDVFVDPIKYYSPDPSILVTVTKKASDALEKAEQVLNINRSLKSAQSGIAKEMDREPEYIEVAKISTDIYRKFGHMLRVVQALREMDVKSDITVNEPMSFDLKTETELLAEFAETQKGMPDSIRYEAYLRYVGQRYAQDETAKRIAEICVDYTIFICYTTQELNERMSSGTIQKSDIVAANYVFQVVTDLHYGEEVDIFEDDDKAIKQKITEALAERIENLKSVETEPMPDDGMDDDVDPTL